MVFVPHLANIQGFKSVVEYLAAEMAKSDNPASCHASVTIEVPRNTPVAYLARYACENFGIDWDRVGVVLPG